MDENEKDASAPGEQPASEPAQNQDENVRYFERSDAKAEKYTGKTTISDGELFVPSVMAEELRRRHGGMVARAYFGEVIIAGILVCIWTAPDDNEGFPVHLSASGKSFRLQVSDVLPHYDFTIPAGRKAKVQAVIDDWRGHKACLILNLSKPNFIAKLPTDTKDKKDTKEDNSK